MAQQELPVLLAQQALIQLFLVLRAQQALQVHKETLVQRAQTQL
jgi:hypothetical protein